MNSYVPQNITQHYDTCRFAFCTQIRQSNSGFCPDHSRFSSGRSDAERAASDMFEVVICDAWNDLVIHEEWDEESVSTIYLREPETFAFAEYFAELWWTDSAAVADIFEDKLERVGYDNVFFE